MSTALRITLVFSISLHMACFGIFEPTFGRALQRLNFTNVSFLGSILKAADFIPLSTNYPQSTDSSRQMRLLQRSALVKIQAEDFLTLKADPVKPAVVLALSTQKPTFIPPAGDLNMLSQRRGEPSITFYPPLPYSFLLYFQDRQKAHIEFMFYVSSKGKFSSLKRKISSGNLEADLISLRYIAHCLNLLEGRSPPDSWQTVKIDLTRKDDKN